MKTLPLNADTDTVVAPLPKESPDRSSLADAVEGSLRRTGYLALRRVQVSTIPSGVQLFGTVPTYFLKQLAQSTALKVRNVHEVRNELEVMSVR